MLSSDAKGNESIREQQQMPDEMTIE